MDVACQTVYFSPFSDSAKNKPTKLHQNGKIQYVLFLLSNIKGKEDKTIS